LWAPPGTARIDWVGLLPPEARLSSEPLPLLCVLFLNIAEFPWRVITHVYSIDRFFCVWSSIRVGKRKMGGRGRKHNGKRERKLNIPEKLEKGRLLHFSGPLPCQFHSLGCLCGLLAVEFPIPGSNTKY